MADQWYQLVDAASYQVWFDNRVTETKETPRPEQRTEIVARNHHLVIDDGHGGLDRVPMPGGAACVVFHDSTPPGEPWHTPREVFARFSMHRPPKVGEWAPCETPDLVAADV